MSNYTGGEVAAIEGIAMEEGSGISSDLTFNTGYDMDRRSLHVIQGGLDQIKVITVCTCDHLQKFIKLPYLIYQDDPYWPGQNDDAELALHDPKTNFPLRYLERQLFIAEKNGEVVGRISASINEEHNKRWNQNIGFFGHFECINDPKVAAKLLQAAEQWVKDHGKDGIWGPFSYTYYDIIGILVQGFQDRPTVGLAYNPDYYPALMEQAGYSKEKDVLEVMAAVEDFYGITQQRASEIEQFIHDDRFVMRTIDESRLRDEFLLVLDLYNDSFSHHWAARKLGGDEWIAMMEASYSIIPSDLFLIVEDQGEPVAFLFLEDDHNLELHCQRHGEVAWCKKRVKAYVIGIKYEYQKVGIGKWILTETAQRLKDMGYEQVSFSWIDESNQKSIRLATGMGGQIDKIFRIYQKEI